MDGAAANTPEQATQVREMRTGSVLVLTLDAPASRNALSEQMIAGLHSAIDRVSNDAGISAVVIQADGPAFCAGHDLKQMTARRSDADRGRAYFTTLMNACAAMMQAIERCPKPVIAAVEGVATAAGCQLVATCDLAIAGPNARFGTPGVNIGLFCSTPMVALSRNVPRKKAMEMLLLGDTLDAEGAALYGLVNKVVPADRVRAEALAWAQKIASKSPLTVAIGKEAFYRQIERGTADAYTMAAEVMVKNMLARDAEEGIGAFIEKRAPEWKGC